jgi:peroxiredoxin
MSERERGPLDFGPDDEDEGRGGPEPAPDSAPPPPSRPRRTSRYGWAVALIFLAWIVYITLNTLSTDSPGSRGVPDDRPLPPFAAPLVLSDLDGDANVARRADQGSAGKRPACEVRGPDILNSCQLAERGPVVLGFYAGRAGKACRQQLDGLERVRKDFPGVQFAAVAIRGDRKDLRELIRDSGWRFPVGYDRDGQVANLYRVAGCPTTTFAYPGGIVMHTYLGLLDDRRLRAAVRRLVAGSERRGWTPPSRT